MARKVVIVGGVAGGMSAATRLRRLDEFAEIVIFERGPFVSFANCGLPYHLSGEIADRSKLIVQTPERLRAVFRLDVRTRQEVTSIDSQAKSVTIRNLETLAESTETYDELILATGAVPIIPSVPGVERPGHFTLRNIPDMDGILAWIEQHQSKTAVILGGGFIGLEAAEQLHQRGLQVTIVERNAQVLTPLDPEMVGPIQAMIRQHGIGLELSNPAMEFVPPTAGEAALASIVVLENGTRLPADIVIIGVGVRPETTLARLAGLTLGSSGGIAVNEQLQTSADGIWAVGDAIEVKHGVTASAAIIPLAGPANRQGRIVADGICGHKSKYPGTLGTAIVRVFELAAAVTGANEALLKRQKQSYEVVHLHPNSHAGYFPGAKPIALKVLFDPDTGRLLGAQAVGPDGVDKRIDVLATALAAEMTVDDLAELELAYAPPYGSAKDPINLAGMAAQNIQNQLVRVAQWHQVPDFLAQGGLLLDVREPQEREHGLIPGSIPIPLAELRDRLAELPKNREIWVHCASGQRSYNACRILTQHGYMPRNLAGSYKTWKSSQNHS